MVLKLVKTEEYERLQNKWHQNKKRTRAKAWYQSEIFRWTQSMENYIAKLMRYQITEFWILCAVNIFFSFEAYKSIRKLMVFFSSLCVDFEQWWEFFARNIVLEATINPFEFGCSSPSFGCISIIKMLQQ